MEGAQEKVQKVTFGETLHREGVGSKVPLVE